MSKFGRRLQRLREAKGLSRRQLELQAGVPHGVISRLESERGDHRAYPSVPVAIRLAKVLGVTLDYLCGVYDEDIESEDLPTMAALA